MLYVTRYIFRVVPILQACLNSGEDHVQPSSIQARE